MKIKFLALCLVLSAVCNAQTNGCLPVFPEGFLLRTFPYNFTLQDTSNTHVTFDNKPIYKSGNRYELRPFKNGSFKIFKVENKDTTYLLKRSVKVQNPPYNVTLGKYENGQTIPREEFEDNNSIVIRIENNNMSLSIPIEEVYILYQKGGSLQKVKLVGPVISKESRDEILGNSNSIFVLDITAKFDEVKVHFPQVVFYIK